MMMDKGKISFSQLTSVCIVVMLSISFLVACGGNTNSTSNGAGSGATATQKNTAVIPTKTSEGQVAVSVSATTKPTVPLVAIRMLDTTHGWALTKSEVLKTADGGQHWNEVATFTSLPNRFATGEFLNANDAWVSVKATQGTFNILRTTNGGATWLTTTISDSAGGNIGQPHFVDTQDGWLEVGTPQGMFHTDADIFHTTDGGQTWSKIASTTNQPTNGQLPAVGNKTGISFKDTLTGWATADIPASYAWLYKTSDGGKTWQSQSLPNPQGVNEAGEFVTMPPVFFGNDGVMPVLVGSAQLGIVLYITHDGGTTWMPTALSGFASTDAYVVDLQHAWATDNSAFYTTSDGGKTWVKLAATPQQIGELSFVDDSNGWAIGTPYANIPLLLHTTDGGKTWQQIRYSIQ